MCSSQAKDIINAASTTLWTSTGCTAEEGYDETHFYVDVQYQRSSSSVGAAAGGAVGGMLLAVILVMLWKYRKAFKRQPGEGAHYDDLFNRQVNVPAANTSSEYETYNVESQHTNQYETLAETSFHEYSVLSPGGKQDYSVKNRATQVTETDRAIVNQENAHVNLSFSETQISFDFVIGVITSIFL
ncbi:hypothetical protein DPMN_142483 [Dreissena polymorpha]|uniref:Uncharacterized protein n=1 Tax=Dreissena polymorpha TaxID=45954 RepID=A0A9D4GHB8_DREPO|nr:hypothetical protein DPMN_142483 [Dreissena polymorpha]